MSRGLRARVRAPRHDFSATWLAVPALLLVALLGAVLLAGVLCEPAPEEPSSVELAVPPMPGDGA